MGGHPSDQRRRAGIAVVGGTPDVGGAGCLGGNPEAGDDPRRFAGVGAGQTDAEGVEQVDFHFVDGSRRKISIAGGVYHLGQAGERVRRHAAPVLGGRLRRH